MVLLILVAYGGPDFAVSRAHGRVEILAPVEARKYSENYVPFLPAQPETLMVDDGTPAGIGANGDPTWKEAVQLPVPVDCQLLGVMFYPGDAYGTNPPLTAYVWDDDGAGGLPGTALWGPQVFTSLVYDDWFYIDLSAEGISLDPGFVYVGWSDENMTDSTNLYWNYYDSAFDGYNYWYDGSSWVWDDYFSGDFMIRAVVEAGGDVAEAGSPTPSVAPVKGGLLLSVPAGSVLARVVDASGRVVFSEVVSGTRKLSLAPGVYFYTVGKSQGKVLVR